MAESIDDRPTPVTTATREWLGTFNPPKNAGIRSRLIDHYSIDPDTAADAKYRWISSLFARFLRNRGA